jgi:hypothetical protein
MSAQHQNGLDVMNVSYAGKGGRWHWWQEEPVAMFHVLAKAGGGKNQWVPNVGGDVSEVLKSSSILWVATKKQPTVVTVIFAKSTY